MDTPIQVSGLTKAFGDHAVLHGVDLTVERGSICALLGRNGAGKSTTLRIMLGLLDADGGEVRLLERSMPADRLSILGQVGSMIEQPSVYGHLTARENLRIDAQIRSLDEAAIDRALEVVELEDIPRPVKHYSMGMKQRLALAIAVLGEPKLLLLDEPTNGLDPTGMVQMRALLRSLPERLDTTVLLSTHLLGEVEQVASHVAILEAGRIAYSGPLSELQAGQQPTLVLRARNMDALAGQINGPVDRDGDRLRLAVRDEDEAASIIAGLAIADVGLYHAALERPGLEAIYLAEIARAESGSAEAGEAA